MANVSPGLLAGTSTTGRPLSASGGGARLTPFCAPTTCAAANSPGRSSPSALRWKSRPIATLRTNAAALPAAQWLSPAAFNHGKFSSAGCSRPWLLPAPQTLRSRAWSGQKPVVSRPANTCVSACAATA